MEQAVPVCPLDPNTFLLQPRPMGYDHLQEIESHISTGSCPLPHPPLKELVFGGPITGTTPLLMASHYGEFDSVKYIVESCGVDVRIPATYYIDPFISDSKIDSATALFVAASNGHSKITRFLLEKGVDVNVKTSSDTITSFDGLTPLYGAVCEFRRLPNQQLNELREERHSVVLALLEFGADPSASCVPPNGFPMWMYHLCGVDTTIALINNGIDLKLHSHSGTTVLHYWASLHFDYTGQDSLAIVKLLAEKGADLMAKNNSGLTPILIAAGACGARPNLTVLDFLLERDNISTIEKIDAMEMAGATILSDPGNFPQFQKAFDYWIRATHLRQPKKKRSHPYRKMLGKNSGGPVEWITWDQLERVIQHPSEYRIQSILMILRILSSRSYAAVESYLSDYFTNSAYNNMWGEGNFAELFIIQGAIMDTLLPFLPRENRAWCLAALIIDLSVRTLWKLKRSNHTLFNLEVIKRYFYHILMTNKFRSSYRERDEVTETFNYGIPYTNALYSFLKLLLRLLETSKEKGEWLDLLLRPLGPHELGSILVEACKEWGTKANHRVKYVSAIRLLLKYGADPNSSDEVGDGPLHFVSRIDHHESEVAGCLLLGFGAQLQRPNNAGKTAMDIFIERNEKEDDEEAARWRHRPDWCRSVPKLQCLSARCVRAHQVPHSKAPAVFQSSIENH